MTWAHWALITAALTWGALMWCITKAPIEADTLCECRDCADTMDRLEVWLDGDQLAFDRKFQEIIKGWR